MRVIDITYRIVIIIKKICNYKNDNFAINAYYQALRELREINKANIASETVSIIGSNKGPLNCIWFNIRNLWKGKKKAESEKSKKPEKWYHTSLAYYLSRNLQYLLKNQK